MRKTLTLKDLENMTEEDLIAYYYTPEGQMELSYYPHLSEYTVEEAVREMMMSMNLTPKKVHVPAEESFE